MLNVLLPPEHCLKSPWVACREGQEDGRHLHCWEDTLGGVEVQLLLQKPSSSLTLPSCWGSRRAEQEPKRTGSTGRAVFGLQGCRGRCRAPAQGSCRTKELAPGSPGPALPRAAELHLREGFSFLGWVSLLAALFTRE